MQSSQKEPIPRFPAKPSPSISVIVPALNEQQVMPALLDHLLSHPDLSECIVVDGGSSDGTVQIVKQTNDPRAQLVHSRPGRGVQMNAGARKATGDLLLFHHADTRLEEGALAALATTARNPELVWGGFLHRFTNANWKLRFISALHNFRFRRTGVVYGDQSMFVRRTYFAQIGGFSEQPLEDMMFSDQALEQANPHRMDQFVTTDSRKFVQMGEFRGLIEVLRIILRYQFNRSFASEAFFAPYR